MSRAPEDLTLANLQERLRSPYDFRCFLLASTRDGRKDRAFYLGELCSRVFKIKRTALIHILRRSKRRRTRIKMKKRKRTRRIVVVSSTSHRSWWV